MTPGFCHLVYTPFTGRGEPGWKGQKWLEERIRVFRKYTLASLLNQSNRNFIHWISWRPEEQVNPLVRALARRLIKLKYRYVFTYGGLAIWDDRRDNEAIELKERLRVNLEPLQEVGRSVENIYQTVLDSDDMLARTAIEEIQACAVLRPRTAVGWRQGFIYNAVTRQIAEWNPATIPPFYTIVFPSDTFLDAVRHYEYIGPYRSHEFVADYLDYTALPKRRFCVVVHSKNWTTSWEHHFRGRVVGKEMLKIFGVVA